MDLVFYLSLQKKSSFLTRGSYELKVTWRGEVGWFRCWCDWELGDSGSLQEAGGKTQLFCTTKA